MNAKVLLCLGLVAALACFKTEPSAEKAPVARKKPQEPPLPPTAAQSAEEVPVAQPEPVAEHEVLGDLEPQTAVLEKDDLRLLVRLEKFDRKNRKLAISTIDGRQYLESVDGQEPYGTDGWMPGLQVEWVAMCWENRPYRLPRSAFADLFDCWPRSLAAEGEKLTFSIGGGDGSASFSANYEFSKSSLRGRRVVYDYVDLQEDDPGATAERSKVRLEPVRDRDGLICPLPGSLAAIEN